MRSGPPEVDPILLQRLEAKGVEANRSARKNGHNQELATRPCQRTTQAIHKGKRLRENSSTGASHTRSMKRVLSNLALRDVQPVQDSKRRRSTVS